MALRIRRNLSIQILHNAGSIASWIPCSLWERCVFSFWGQGGEGETISFLYICPPCLTGDLEGFDLLWLDCLMASLISFFISSLIHAMRPALLHPLAIQGISFSSLYSQL